MADCSDSGSYRDLGQRIHKDPTDSLIGISPFAVIIVERPPWILHPMRIAHNVVQFYGLPRLPPGGQVLPGSRHPNQLVKYLLKQLPCIF